MAAGLVVSGANVEVAEKMAAEELEDPEDDPDPPTVKSAHDP